MERMTQKNAPFKIEGRECIRVGWGENYCLINTRKNRA